MKANDLLEMKKEFITPVLELVVIANVDIITTSPYDIELPFDTF